SGNQAEAAADFPSATETVATDGGEDVRLVELEEALRLVRAVLANASRERVRDESEEARVRLVANQRFEAVRGARADVAELLHDEIVVLAVEAFDRSFDLTRDFLLDAEAVLVGDVRAKTGHAEDGIRLLRLRRLREATDAALHRGLREALRELL